jgi:hypothetical protein
MLLLTPRVSHPDSVFEIMGRTNQIDRGKNVAYWWDGDPAERYWVEIRKEPGTGTGVWCPTLDEDGSRDPWYELVASVRRDEVIYHWHAREHRFVGRSIAAANAQTNHRDAKYEVPVREFTPIAADVSLAQVRAQASALYRLRDELQRKHGSPLYLPFQFTKNRARLSFMSNYFAKLPSAMVESFFGPDGLAEHTLPVATEESPGPLAAPGADPRGFLLPFRPKSDTKYVVDLQGGRRIRSREHERLVNRCAAWLSHNGLQPARNAAVDLGLELPPVVIEAKVIGASWAKPIREAVGQLYEYRYFKVTDPASRLIFLADKRVPPSWVSYLERDREIGVVATIGNRFELSRLARRALRI